MKSGILDPQMTVPLKMPPNDVQDEHIWFYEDPQGNTQGEFTDAQMYDWYASGRYFTPHLRLRRKCDSSFATLEDYSKLFNRIPFSPGPRVLPQCPPVKDTLTAASLRASGPNGFDSFQNLIHSVPPPSILDNKRAPVGSRPCFGQPDSLMNSITQMVYTNQQHHPMYHHVSSDMPDLANQFSRLKAANTDVLHDQSQQAQFCSQSWPNPFSKWSSASDAAVGGGESSKIPLSAAYASNNNNNTSNKSKIQAQFLAQNTCLVTDRLSAAKKLEENYDKVLQHQPPSEFWMRSLPVPPVGGNLFEMLNESSPQASWVRAASTGVQPQQWTSNVAAASLSNGATLAAAKTKQQQPAVVEGTAAGGVVTASKKAAKKSQQQQKAPTGSVESAAGPDENELNKLIKWTQDALQGMHFEEELDIPTVVELLAVIDNPYEVETMFKSYLGDSPKVQQFVKDFLDRRRPYWQSHRSKAASNRAAKNQRQTASTLVQQSSSSITNHNQTTTINNQQHHNQQSTVGRKTAAAVDYALSAVDDLSLTKKNSVMASSEGQWKQSKTKSGRKNKNKNANKGR